MLTALRENRVLPAEGYGREDVFYRKGETQAFREQQKVARFENRASGGRHQMARLVGGEQVRIGIDRRARHDEPRDGIQRIMLDDAKDSSRLQDAQRFRRQQ